MLNFSFPNLLEKHISYTQKNLQFPIAVFLVSECQSLRVHLRHEITAPLKKFKNRWKAAQYKLQVSPFVGKQYAKPKTALGAEKSFQQAERTINANFSNASVPGHHPVLKNRFCVILRPSDYAHTILLKSVNPFRKSIVSNTVTRVFYILEYIRYTQNYGF